MTCQAFSSSKWQGQDINPSLSDSKPCNFSQIAQPNALLSFRLESTQQVLHKENRDSKHSQSSSSFQNKTDTSVYFIVSLLASSFHSVLSRFLFPFLSITTCINVEK